MFVFTSAVTIYLTMLLTLALIFWYKGIPVWKQSVRDTILIEVPESAPEPATPAAQPAYTMNATAPPASYEPTQYEATKYEPTKYGTPSAMTTPTLQSVPYLSTPQNPPANPPAGGNVIQV